MSHFSTLDIQRQNLINDINDLCETCFHSIADQYEVSADDIAEMMRLTSEDLTFIDKE